MRHSFIHAALWSGNRRGPIAAEFCALVEAQPGPGVDRRGTRAWYHERPTVRREEGDYKFTDFARLCPKPFRRKSRRDRPGLWPDLGTARQRRYWIRPCRLHRPEPDRGF